LGANSASYGIGRSFIIPSGAGIAQGSGIADSAETAVGGAAALEAVRIRTVADVANPIGALVVSGHAGSASWCQISGVAVSAGVSDKTCRAGNAASAVAGEAVRIVCGRTSCAYSTSRCIVTCSCVANCTISSGISISTSFACCACETEGAG